MRGESASQAGLLIMIGFLFLALTNFLDIDQHWFSSNLNYRYQTEALLEGNLALQEHPRKLAHDWAWGKGGAHQIWGLGVPLLRLPFELVAKATGKAGFPDRVVLVLLYLTVAYQLLRSFTRASTSPREPIRIGEAGIITCLLMLASLLLTLVSTRFDIYEEAVTYQILWSLLLLALLVRFSAQSKPSALLALVVASSFAPLIRPTAIFYGGATFILALLLAISRRLPRRVLLAAVLMFASGPLLVITTNQLRFGHPLVFGHSLSLSRISANDFALRFGYPYQSEPLASAARELAAALFSTPRLNGHMYYAHPLHPWFSNTLRWREFYLPSFGYPALALAIVAWLSGLVRMLWISKKSRFVYQAWSAPASMMLLWSAISFAALFLFYLRSPSISSRYLMDFYPALAAATASLIWSQLPTIRRRIGIFYGPFVLAALLLVVNIEMYHYEQDHRFIPFRYRPTPSFSLAQIANLVPRSETWRSLPASIFDPPKQYTCVSRPQNLAAPREISGWGYNGHCAVQSFTSAFLGSSPCVALSFRRTPNQATASFNTTTGEPLRVWSNLDPLIFQRGSINNDVFSATFCRQSKSPEPEEIRLISVGWVDQEKLTRAEQFPFILYVLGEASE